MGVQINGATGNVIATKGTFSGNVGIAGTLTYEDVTDIDAVGLVTARSGIEIGASPGVGASISRQGNAIFSGITTIGSKEVGAGITLSPDGNIFASGVTTSTTFSGSGANLTNLPAANITGTLPAISAANLTNIPAANITGTLPAIDGSNLTGVASPNIGATETQGYQNLKIRTTANNSTVITCDSVLLANTSGVLVKVDSVNVTLDATGTGLNGLDTGSLSGGKFYYIWIINNGSTTGAIASLSSTSPTLPSGYTYKARVGGVATDTTSSDNLLLGQQINSSYQFARVESDIVKVTNGSGAVTNSQFGVSNVSALASSWTAFIKTYGATNAGTTHRWKIQGTSGTNDGAYAQIWQTYHVNYNGIGDMNFQIPFIPVVELSSGVPQAYMNSNSNSGPNWTVYCTGFKY